MTLLQKVKKRPGLSIFAFVVLLQLGGFYGLESYLTPHATAASSKAVTAPVKQSLPKLVPPTDAQLFDVDANGNTLVFYDNHDNLVVESRQGKTLAVENMVGTVDYLQWMDNGLTVFYVREIYGHYEIGVYKVATQELVPLHDLYENDITVEKVYKSSYSQSIHMIYKSGDQYELGFYEALYGYRSELLSGITPKDSWFDEKEDVLYIRDEQGTVWRYMNGRPMHGNSANQ